MKCALELKCAHFTNCNVRITKAGYGIECLKSRCAPFARCHARPNLRCAHFVSCHAQALMDCALVIEGRAFRKLPCASHLRGAHFANCHARPRLKCAHFASCHARLTNEWLRCAHFPSCHVRVTGTRVSIIAGLRAMRALLVVILASVLVRCAQHKIPSSEVCALRARQGKMLNVDRKSMIF